MKEHLLGSTEEVFVQQKAAIKALTGADYRASCKNIFKQHKIPIIPSLLILGAGKLREEQLTEAENCPKKE